MTHPFEYRAHYNGDGDVCHCPWGYGPEHQERYGSVKQSSKMDWLRGRPDMQTPEGQQWLNFLEEPDYRGNSFAQADKMLPFLTREWKKGRMKPSPPGEMAKLYYKVPYEAPAGTLEGWHGQAKAKEIIDAQDALQEMGKRSQGVDIMQHTMHELIPKVQHFQDWKRSQGRDHLGEPLHRFDNGWEIRRLRDENEMLDEGREMGHCLAEPGKTYHEDVENGSKLFASLRDHNNLPHATIEMRPTQWEHPTTGEVSNTHGYQQMAEHWKPLLQGATVGQFYGKQDAPPIPEYENKVQEWLAPHNVNVGGSRGLEAWHWLPELNQQREDEIQSFSATRARPLYFRWVYSPHKGVTVNTNQEAHPALVKYHGDLGNDINDTDLSHGYASAIDGGWRITDLEHRPVEDPYIVNQVVRRLNLEDAPQMRSEGSWQPSEYDYDRLHYGLPAEK